MNEQIQLSDLNEFSLLTNSNIKIVRHADTRRNESLKQLYREDKDKVLFYQEHQGKDIFNGLDVILSFIGEDQTKALFIGAFKVESVVQLDESYFLNLSHEKLKWIKGSKYKYTLRRIFDFGKYENRLIIEWGKSTVSWHQWYINNGKLIQSGNKEIVELLPKGYSKDFPGLMNINISFRELRIIIQNPDAHREWKNQLSVFNGIYLIHDKKSGEQYVGGTYSNENGCGIWDRWGNYASSLDGGNEKMKQIKIEKGDDYLLQNFFITLLELLPLHYYKKQIQVRESLYKKKLGTRTHGLNLN